ncbi:MAG: hypothetical protein JWR03_2438 [Cohnella sp.]|nr:hypothetical protein [Cohnella sp.]
MLEARIRVLFWQPTRLADGFGLEQAALSFRAGRGRNSPRIRRVTPYAAKLVPPFSCGKFGCNL